MNFENTAVITGTEVLVKLVKWCAINPGFGFWIFEFQNTNCGFLNSDKNIKLFQIKLKLSHYIKATTIIIYLNT